MSVKTRILNILFWSIVSAAFIGPGTITTAASAGASYNLSLLWALLFSTFACLVLQEAAARIPMASGKNLGQAIAHQFEGSKAKWPILILVLGAIVLGSAAYETGNILGGMSGLQLIFPMSNTVAILLIALAAILILMIPSLKIIATIMGFVVMLLGLVFFVVATSIPTPLPDLLKGLFVPTIQTEKSAGWLVLGLIGTTIVPYNLFLGSGISNKKQSIKEMRIALAVAIVLGGIFSMAVVVVGSAVTGQFSFDNLAAVLEARMGIWGRYLLGLGLFAAGFTSAVTAPLAASITLKSLFGNKNPENWSMKSIRYRVGWILVLATGVILSLLKIKPIPAIIAAQAFNGMLLPFVALFLFIVINNKSIMGEQRNKSVVLNIATLVILFITMVLGLNNVGKALLPLLFSVFQPGLTYQITITGIATVIILLLAYNTFRVKK